jgi:hypothetical protein
MSTSLLPNRGMSRFFSPGCSELALPPGGSSATERKALLRLAMSFVGTASSVTEIFRVSAGTLVAFGTFSFFGS